MIIDADAVAREVVAPGTPGLAEIAATFGPEVLDAGGALDRGRLGEIVFADSGLLGKLNAIVHPLVAERMLEIERAAPPDAVVVHDVPLLAENRLADQYDVVVVVDVPTEVQLDRLTRLRGMPEDQARARLGAQASRAAAAGRRRHRDGQLRPAGQASTTGLTACGKNFAAASAD